MKKISLLILVLLISCKPEKKETIKIEPIRELETPKIISKEKTQTKHEINFANSFFEIGEKRFFEEECEFYFPCDCCMSDLYLKKDSTFAFLEYCQSDTNLSYGIFNISNDSLNLKFSYREIQKKYNWEYEFDNSKIPYFYTDTLVQPKIEQFSFKISKCSQKIKLENENCIGITKTRSHKIKSIIEETEKISSLTSKQVFENDTISISNNTIIFIKPTESEFEKLSKTEAEEWIYEVDSDFKYYYSTSTIDSIKKLNINTITPKNKVLRIINSNDSIYFFNRELDSMKYGAILNLSEKIKVLKGVYTGIDLLTIINEVK